MLIGSEACIIYAFCNYHKSNASLYPLKYLNSLMFANILLRHDVIALPSALFRRRLVKYSCLFASRFHYVLIKWVSQTCQFVCQPSPVYFTTCCGEANSTIIIWTSSLVNISIKWSTVSQIWSRLVRWLWTRFYSCYRDSEILLFTLHFKLDK